MQIFQKIFQKLIILAELKFPINLIPDKQRVMHHNLLSQEMYPIYFKLNNQSEEHVTEIYIGHIPQNTRLVAEKYFLNDRILSDKI